MTQQPNDAPVTDVELETATGGGLEGEPFNQGDTIANSGPENNVGSTTC